MALLISALPGGLGAEVTGYDPGAPADHRLVARFRAALIEHHLLLLRGRTFEPAQQIALTAIFGDVLQTCSPRLRYLADFPAIFRVSNRQEQGHPNIGCYWHSDGAYVTDPTAISIHHIILPTSDGDTLYADLARAYESLPPALQQRVRGVHTRSQTGVAHPLVKAHPVTGRPGLYVNFDPGATLLDERAEQQSEVTALIRAHLDHAANHYRHRWQPGDLIIIDNFAVAHQATGADPRQLRVLHRTSIHGPSVWWRQAAASPVSQPEMGALRSAAAAG